MELKIEIGCENENCNDVINYDLFQTLDEDCPSCGHLKRHVQAIKLN